MERRRGQVNGQSYDTRQTCHISPGHVLHFHSVSLNHPKTHGIVCKYGGIWPGDCEYFDVDAFNSQFLK